MIKICCVCHRVEQKNIWVRPAVATVTDKISHGYCPACYQEMLLELDRYSVQEKTVCSERVPVSSNYAAARVCAS